MLGAVFVHHKLAPLSFPAFDVVTYVFLYTENGMYGYGIIDLMGHLQFRTSRADKSDKRKPQAVYFYWNLKKVNVTDVRNMNSMRDQYNDIRFTNHAVELILNEGETEIQGLGWIIRPYEKSGNEVK
jgi:hypothetical protein